MPLVAPLPFLAVGETETVPTLIVEFAVEVGTGTSDSSTVVVDAAGCEGYTVDSSFGTADRNRDTSEVEVDEGAADSDISGIEVEEGAADIDTS